MIAYYFPRWCNEVVDEALFVPKQVMIGRLGEKYGGAYNIEDLTSMKEFVAHNRTNLKKTGLMRIVRVSADLVNEFKECVSKNNFHFSKLIAMQLLQSARGYGKQDEC